MYKISKNLICPGIMLSLEILVILEYCMSQKKNNKFPCEFYCSCFSLDLQQWSNFLTVILLPANIAVIKTEAHSKRTKLAYQGNMPADFHAQVAETKSVKAVTHVHEVYSALSTQYWLSFAILIFL